MSNNRKCSNLLPLHMAELPTSKRYGVVTGGTDGIGKAIAFRLASSGVGLVLVGRHRDKGEAAAQAIRGRTGNQHVSFEQADLGLMREVNRLADKLMATLPRLDYLVLSAGIVRGQRVLTGEGVESNFAVTYLGRFALVQRVLPMLAASGRSSAASQILVIGGAAQGGTIHYSDVSLSRGFATLKAVSQFCAANDLFVVEQNRRIEAQGWTGRVTIASLKVGAVKTAIRRQFPLWMKVLVPLLIDPFITLAPDTIAASAEQLLLDPAHETASGRLFRQIRHMVPAREIAQTHDPDEGRRLWAASEGWVASALADSARTQHTPGQYA